MHNQHRCIIKWYKYLLTLIFFINYKKDYIFWKDRLYKKLNDESLSKTNLYSSEGYKLYFEKFVCSCWYLKVSQKGKPRFCAIFIVGLFICPHNQKTETWDSSPVKKIVVPKILSWVTFSSVQFSRSVLSCVSLFVTPWIAACQAH